jgi:hypothetical protein
VSEEQESSRTRGSGRLLARVALVDVTADRLPVVPLAEEVQYTFRDLARGPRPAGVLLGTG